jgi:hypothetical protein
MVNKGLCERAFRELNPDLKVGVGVKWGKGRLIHYRVTSDFNGLASYGGELVRKIEMPDLVVPPGYVVRGIGIALELNRIPFEATALVLEEKKC